MAADERGDYRVCRLLMTCIPSGDAGESLVQVDGINGSFLINHCQVNSHTPLMDSDSQP